MCRSARDPRRNSPDATIGDVLRQGPADDRRWPPYGDRRELRGRRRAIAAPGAARRVGALVLALPDHRAGGRGDRDRDGGHRRPRASRSTASRPCCSSSADARSIGSAEFIPRPSSRGGSRGSFARPHARRHDSPSRPVSSLQRNYPRETSRWRRSPGGTSRLSCSLDHGRLLALRRGWLARRDLCGEHAGRQSC